MRNWNIFSSVRYQATMKKVQGVVTRKTVQDTRSSQRRGSSWLRLKRLRKASKEEGGWSWNCVTNWEQNNKTSKQMKPEKKIQQRLGNFWEMCLAMRQMGLAIIVLCYGSGFWFSFKNIFHSRGVMTWKWVNVINWEVFRSAHIGHRDWAIRAGMMYIQRWNPWAGESRQRDELTDK